MLSPVHYSTAAPNNRLYFIVLCYPLICTVVSFSYESSKTFPEQLSRLETYIRSRAGLFCLSYKRTNPYINSLAFY